MIDGIEDDFCEPRRIDGEFHYLTIETRKMTTDHERNRVYRKADDKLVAEAMYYGKCGAGSNLMRNQDEQANHFIQQGREEGVAWQPIHTAPTSDLHRVEVLLCHHGRQGWTQIGWWSKHLQQWVADYDGMDCVIAEMTDPPTHWMQIPYRPADQSTEGEK